MTNIKVFYHDPCPDGFCSAYLCWLNFKESATYHPLKYGQELPEVSKEDTVYFVDFSLKRLEMFKLSEKVREVVVLDHHKTAQDELKDLPTNVITYFDMSKCGAHLVWNYFWPTMPVPDLIKYVEDRDLWKWKLPKSKEVSAALYSYPQEFKVWDELRLLDKGSVDALATEGDAILRSQDQIIKSLIPNRHIIRLAGDNYLPAVNTSVLPSEVANELIKKFQIPMAACYHRLPSGGWKFSLRGGGSVDVTEIAKLYGGGGHHSAAGFIVNDNSFFI